MNSIKEQWLGIEAKQELIDRRVNAMAEAAHTDRLLSVRRRRAQTAKANRLEHEKQMEKNKHIVAKNKLKAERAATELRLRQQLQRFQEWRAENGTANNSNSNSNTPNASKNQLESLILDTHAYDHLGRPTPAHEAALPTPLAEVYRSVLCKRWREKHQIQTESSSLRAANASYQKVLEGNCNLVDIYNLSHDKTDLKYWPTDDDRCWEHGSNDPRASVQQTLHNYRKLMRRLKKTFYRSQQPSMIQQLLFGADSMPNRSARKGGKTPEQPAVEWDNRILGIHGIPKYDAIADPYCGTAASPDFLAHIQRTREIDPITKQQLQARILKQQQVTLEIKNYVKRPASASTHNPYAASNAGRPPSPRKSKVRPITARNFTRPPVELNVFETTDWYIASREWEEPSELAELIAIINRPLVSDSAIEGDALRVLEQSTEKDVDTARRCLEKLCGHLCIPKVFLGDNSRMEDNPKREQVEQLRTKFNTLMSRVAALVQLKERIMNVISLIEERETTIDNVNQSNSDPEVHHWLGQLSVLDDSVLSAIQQAHQALPLTITHTTHNQENKPQLFMFKGIDYPSKITQEVEMVQALRRNPRDSGARSGGVRDQLEESSWIGLESPSDLAQAAAAAMGFSAPS